MEGADAVNANMGTGISFGKCNTQVLNTLVPATELPQKCIQYPHQARLNKAHLSQLVLPELSLFSTLPPQNTC